MSDNPSTEDLRKLLRARIGEKQVKRSTHVAKEKILEKTLQSIGVDKEKLKDDLEAITKQKGLTINLKK